MEVEMIDISLARAAQSAYNRAGFPKDEAFQRGQQVARYVHENLDTVQKLYHMEDEIELAYRVAMATVAYEKTHSTH
jgi:hypothetical protein